MSRPAATTASTHSYQTRSAAGKPRLVVGRNFVPKRLVAKMSVATDHSAATSRFGPTLSPAASTSRRHHLVATRSSLRPPQRLNVRATTPTRPLLIATNTAPQRRTFSVSPRPRAAASNNGTATRRIAEPQKTAAPLLLTVSAAKQSLQRTSPRSEAEPIAATASPRRTFVAGDAHGGDEIAASAKPEETFGGDPRDGSDSVAEIPKEDNHPVETVETVGVVPSSSRDRTEGGDSTVEPTAASVRRRRDDAATPPTVGDRLAAYRPSDRAAHSPKLSPAEISDDEEEPSRKRRAMAATAANTPLSALHAESFASLLAAAVKSTTVGADVSAANGAHCSPCNRDFQSPKLLQQHTQSYHADKHFVCEICQKAFRFRSNLAEHRSVHTALKPFVCKFCGKSSRLKGNLTKHILKHHKTEQLDCIGTDDIIIKKGKKSVKDPAAIEFLEKSMIVLNANGQPTGSPAAHSRHSTSNLSASDGSVTPSSTRAAGGMDERCFLLSLGLDNGSLDLKAESSESDSSVMGNANEQLLEKCNMMMETDEPAPMADEDPTDSTAASPTTPASSALASAAANALFFGSAKRHNYLDGLAEELGRQRGGAVAAVVGNAGSTTCPECGKHVRKPRDLIAHLATIHGIAPAAAPVAEHSPVATAATPAPPNGIQADLRQLMQLVLEMKAASVPTETVEKLVSNIDSRVARLEKQLEMALNSIYTLVQLQTGINTQVTRFRDDANDQLKTVVQMLSQKSV